MRTNPVLRKKRQNGSGLLVTLIMTAIALATLAGAMAWSASTARLNERANQYARSVAAAEANTEAVISRIARDFKNGGARVVMDNQSSYQQNTLVVAGQSTWKGWEFSDTSGRAGQTLVSIGNFDDYADLDSNYSGLRGWVCPVSVISNARLTNTVQDVVAGVRQSLQLANIPIFQFAMFSSGDMEIGNGQPLRITGKVHSNKMLYIEPISDLTFESDVTAVREIKYDRHPLDTRVDPYGPVVYMVPKREHVPALTLPIGADNSPEAVREILQPPPAGEDASSPLGRQRYYNLADMIVTVTDSGITTTTGVPFNRSTTITTLSSAITLPSTSFTDAREEKVVRTVNINIDTLRKWSTTNQSLFGGRVVSSIYVLDKRTLPSSELAAVRVLNGKLLPDNGLTIATARPLYVQGHYNQGTASHLGTANTSNTRPASLIADAITVLSGAWSDGSSALPVLLRLAIPTTVNAALLTGVVETSAGQYSGGMENFPRFLETWGELTTFTYNGSMVKMFPSKYATGVWGKSNVYDPPKRNWAYDMNFNNATKLPPLTPSLQKVLRGQWTTLAPRQTTSSVNL